MGGVAKGDPWETPHKIRFGQPDEEMPAMAAFPAQDQVDVFTYAQSLPTQ